MEQTFDEHDVVALLEDLPAAGLSAGDTGTIVHVYSNAPAFEVEFPDPTGKEHFIVQTVASDKLLKLRNMTWCRAAG